MGIRFRMKRGMGKHYRRQRGEMVCVRPGDEIVCDPDELGNAKFKFEQLDPTPPPPEPNVGLKLVHKGGGWYDVVNEVSGQKINDELLKKNEALELVRKYEEGTETGPETTE